MSIRQFLDPLCVADTTKSTEPPTDNVWDFAVSDKDTSLDPQSTADADALGVGTADLDTDTSVPLIRPTTAAIPLAQLTTLKTTTARTVATARPATIRRRRYTRRLRAFRAAADDKGFLVGMPSSLGHAYPPLPLFHNPISPFHDPIRHCSFPRVQARHSRGRRIAPSSRISINPSSSSEATHAST